LRPSLESLPGQTRGLPISELGRVPKTEEIEQAFTLARVLYKAVLGLHYKRQEQKKNGQLAIF